MKSDNKHLYSLGNQMRRYPIRIRVLNSFGNFVILDRKNISLILDSDGFSLSKGADANDMKRMNRTATAKASIITFAVAGLDMAKINNIYVGIKNKIITHKEYEKVTLVRPALFIAVIQRNKEDSNIARLDDVQFIERDTIQNIRGKAKRLKRNNQMCLNGKISCLTKSSRVNKSVYYENLFLVVGKEG